MDTSIYIGLGLQILPQIVDVWVDALLSRRTIKIISFQVCRLSRRYSFQASHVHNRVENIFKHVLFNTHDIKVMAEDISLPIKKLIENILFYLITSQTKTKKILLNYRNENQI
jgi:hypothetical protein